MQAHPIHMWDAGSGDMRCTYRAYDAADEVTAATSLAFSLDGNQLLGGFGKVIRTWDTSRPGRDYTELVTFKKKSEGLPGNCTEPIWSNCLCSSERFLLLSLLFLG